MICCWLHPKGKKAAAKAAAEQRQGEEHEEDEEEEEDEADGQPGGNNPFAALADLKGALSAPEFVPHRCSLLTTCVALFDINA